MKSAGMRVLCSVILLLIVMGNGRQWATAAGEQMYWTDLGIRKIQRINLDGSGLEDLVTKGLIAPRAIAIDSAGGKIYWTDSITLKIQRANLDDTQVQNLVTTGRTDTVTGTAGLPVYSDYVLGSCPWRLSCMKYPHLAGWLSARCPVLLTANALSVLRTEIMKSCGAPCGNITSKWVGA